MTTLVVHPAEKPLVGSVPVPSDAGIGIRALLLAALSEGETRIVERSRGADSLATAACLRTLGVSITEASPNERIVSGVGLSGLRVPAGAIACGPSQTLMVLLCSLLCAHEVGTILDGDDSLSRRPMMRIVSPLRRRGALVEGRPDPGCEAEITAPLVVRPLPARRRLSGVQHESTTVDADVKSALLLSGLYADGPTLFKEPMVSSDHTERLLVALGVPIRTFGTLLELDPAGWDRRIPEFQFAIPGDLSAAALLVAAAQLVPGSRLTTRDVGVNPTRSGLLEIARDMGAGLAIEPQGDRNGEPVATLHAWNAPLRGVAIGGERVERARAEIPIACALAARAAGTTRVTLSARLTDDPRPDANIDGIAPLIGLLRAFGVACAERPGGLEIQGRKEPFEAAQVDSRGDPQIATTAAILALVANGPTRILDAGCIATSYAKFAATMRALGARIDVEG